MKFRYTATIIMLLALIQILTITCFAAATPKIGVADVQALTDEDRSIIEKIIEDNATYFQTSVKNLLTHNPQVCPDSYRLDTTLYYLEYHPNDSFLADLSSPSFNGPTDGMFGEHPNIYIPIFGTTNGKERIVGHVKLYYDAIDKTYIYQTSMMNTRSEAFLSGENIHFLEQLDVFQNYDSVSKTLGKTVTGGILVRMPYTSSDRGEKVFLVKAGNQWLVHDYTNSAHLEEGSERAVLTPSEYSELRSAYENSLSTDKVPLEDVVFGGTPAGGMSASGVSDNSSQQDSGTSTWLLTGGILVLAVTVGSAVLIKMSRRKTPAA